MGYFPNAEKCWLIIKPEREQVASEFFGDTAINVTIEGHKHLSAAQGSRSFLEEYVGEKVDEWVSEVTKLTDFTISLPQASYAAFTSGLRHRWTYFLRTALIGCYKANFWNSFRSYIYQCLEIWYSIAIAK